MTQELTPEEINRINQLTDLISEERFYELLGVSPHATIDTIRTSYYGLSRQWHPDRFFNRQIGKFHQEIEEI